MALSADIGRSFSPQGPNDSASFLVNGTDTIYQGAAVGLDASGYAIPLTTSAIAFVGFCRHQADNSAGADGALSADVLCKGVIRGVTVTGATQASIGADVFMSDDETFTLTIGSNIKVGHLQRYDATEGSDVFFLGRTHRSTT